MLEEIWQQHFLGPFLFSNNSWSIGQNTPPLTEGVSAHHCSKWNHAAEKLPEDDDNDSGDENSKFC